jgi:AcrR family transcriptional regulator
MHDADGAAIRRRPRMSPDRVMDLLTATMDALREVGYANLSMDLVALRARCSKATLYRLWPSKPQLVGAALYATRPVKVEQINTGTLRGDLQTIVGLLATQAEKDTALFAAMSHAVLTDDELALAVRTSLVEPWFAELTGVVDRAVVRGELPSRPAAAEFLPGLLLSATFTHPLFGTDAADTDYLTRCLDEVLLPALQAAAPAHTARDSRRKPKA